MCPSGYHHNGFVATHAVGHHVPKYMSCHKAIVVITGRAQCFHDNILLYHKCLVVELYYIYILYIYNIYMLYVIYIYVCYMYVIFITKGMYVIGQL